MKIGDTYYSAESAGGIYVRSATSLEGLGASDVRRDQVWSDPDNIGDIWAPEITTDAGRTFIHFSGGKDAAHRMYVISADAPLGSTYSGATKLNLPDDQWAIDGTFFVFEGKGWFVWSGWENESKGSVEQNLYICRMDSPSQPTGARYIISQPRESWEKGDKPLINEGPEAIVDPNGQLHIVYSCNGSWGNKYCLADLRLKKGGDPTAVWDWYKSNGCLFGSHQDYMMKGWDATKSLDGPGHHTFALDSGDVNKSPGGTDHIPFVFHAVEKGTEYNWGNRAWYTGTFVWWSKTTYTRKSVPGDKSNEGYSFKFFE
jgi:GH43 family beta-xylosidase